MDSPKYTVLLVPDEECAGALRDALSTRYEADTLIVVVDGPTGKVVSDARALHGGAPIGYVSFDEALGLDALRHGADEAMVWPPPNRQALHGFLDRTWLRAGLRREQEDLRAKVVHSEKLAALGTLVAGVAHEINNPLTALQLCSDAFRSLLRPAMNVAEELGKLAARRSGADAETIERLATLARTGAPAREGIELLEEMTVASQGIADIVRDLRIFARADAKEEKGRIIDVSELVDQALRLVGREIEAFGIVERDYAPNLPKVVAPPGRLNQVLINILVNAAHAIREVPRDHHSVRISTRADEEYVAISVTDTGPGIPSSALDHVFDPFFTTKRVGTGTGLGLSISRAIMRDLGGDLILTSVHGDGATFIALVPIADTDTVRDAMRRTSLLVNPSQRVARPSVLCVDDNSAVLKAYGRALGRTCNVLVASDGREAIELLESGSTPDVVISELSLPEVDGPELYLWLQHERPTLARRMLFVTADAAGMKWSDFLSSLENQVLAKPVNGSRLMEAIQAAISR